MQLATATSTQPDELQHRFDRDAQQDAMRRGDKVAYLEAGASEADWGLKQLIDDMNRPYESEEQGRF